MNENDVKTFYFSGLTTAQALDLRRRIGLLPDHVRMVDSLHLGQDCTHLVAPFGIGKTEKVLSALAKGIPIVPPNVLDKSNTLLNDIDAFDIGANAESVVASITTTNIPSLGHRKKMAVDHGGAFRGWKVGLLLDDSKSGVYSRILHFGKASKVAVLRSPLPDLPELAVTSEGLTHILSEPTFLDNQPSLLKMAENQGNSVKILSYLIVVELLVKECDFAQVAAWRRRLEEAFRLDSKDIRNLHEFQKQPNQPPVSGFGSRHFTSPSLSVSTTMSDCKRFKLEEGRRAVIPLRRIDSPGPPPDARTPKRVFSVDGRMVSSSFKALFKDQHCEGPVATATLIGGKSLIKATEKVRLFQAQETAIGLDRSDCGSRQRAPRDSKSLATLDSCFHTFYESATSRNSLSRFGLDDSKVDDTGGDHQEVAAGQELWLQMLHFYESSMSSTELPSVQTLRSILTEGILMNRSPLVRHRASRLVHQLLHHLHPPGSNALLRKYYSRLFSSLGSQSQGDLAQSEEMWDFFWNVLTGGRRSSPAEGRDLLCDLLLTILEMDFDPWVASCLQSGLVAQEDLPLFCKLMWKDELGATNRRARVLFEAYSENMAEDRDAASADPFRRLLAMLAVAVDLFDKAKEMDEYKAQASEELGRSIRKVVDRGNVASETIWCHIYLLVPAWFASLVIFRILNHNLSGGVAKNLLCPLRAFEANYVLNMEDLGGRISMEEARGGRTSMEEARGGRTSLKEATRPGSSKAGSNPAASIMKKATKQNQFGETPLHLACRMGQLSKVKDLLSIDGVDPNAKDFNGWTPLHEACFHGRTDCAKAMIASGSVVDLRAAGGEEANTPLHEAVAGSYPEIVSALLDAAESSDLLLELLSLKNGDGATAIDLAIKNQHMRDLLEQAFAKASSVHGRVAKSLVTRTFTPDIVLRLSSLYYLKYCSGFKLHIVKEIMRGEGVQRPGCSPCHFRMEPPTGRRKWRASLALEPNSLNDFPVSRDDLIQCQDIRTFWNAGRIFEGNPALCLLLRRKADADEETRLSLY